jgi:hypothetical protein
MMENKWSLRTDAMPSDYGVCRVPTEHVDKFVQNYRPSRRRAASARGFDKLMTNSAIETPMKSTAYYAAPCATQAIPPGKRPSMPLWSVGAHYALCALKVKDV